MLLVLHGVTVGAVAMMEHDWVDCTAMPSDETFRYADQQRRARRMKARRTKEQNHELAKATASMRLAHEVMPIDEVINAYAAMMGDYLYAKQCRFPNCGKWYCIRESSTGVIRPATSKSHYCSERCRSNDTNRKWREKQKLKKEQE